MELKTLREAFSAWRLGDLATRPGFGARRLLNGHAHALAPFDYAYRRQLRSRCRNGWRMASIIAPATPSMGKKASWFQLDSQT